MDTVNSSLVPFDKIEAKNFGLKHQFLTFKTWLSFQVCWRDPSKWIYLDWPALLTLSLVFLKTCLWYVYSSVPWDAVFFSFKFYCTFSYYYTVCGCFLLHAHLHSHHFEKHDFSCIIFSFPNNMNYNFLEVHLQKLRALYTQWYDTPGIKINMVGCPSF